MQLKKIPDSIFLEVFNEYNFIDSPFIPIPSNVGIIVEMKYPLLGMKNAIDKCLVYEDVMEHEDFEDEHDENGKKKLSKNDFDISSSVRSIKVDETNNYDENKKKDDIDNLKMSDFTNSTEKKSINN